MTVNMKKYIALFDWDKTIRNNYSFRTWLELLVERNILDKGFLEFDNNNFNDFLTGKIDHDELSKRFGIKLGEYMEGISVKETKKLLPEYKGRDDSGIYPIMRTKIFPYLAKNNIKAIIISGGHQPVIEVYKQELGIDEIYGVDFGIEDGRYTNQMLFNIGIGKNKRAIVEKVEKENPNAQILFGFGDSTSDIPILEAAEYSFVNNKERFLERPGISYLDFGDAKSGDEMVRIMSAILKREE